MKTIGSFYYPPQSEWLNLKRRPTDQNEFKLFDRSDGRKYHSDRDADALASADTSPGSHVGGIYEHFGYHNWGTSELGQRTPLSRLKSLS
jgi:hypothetical protein